MEENEEDMEELRFIPGAVSESQWSLHCATTKLVAIVTQGGGKACTINLCKQCYGERQLKEGERRVTGLKVEGNG